MFCDFPKYKHLKQTIYRGSGGGGNADSDAEINALTALTNQALAYSEAAGLEADAAAVSAAAASTSAASAATSASGAATSATNAASSASSASTSASSASTSATNAASSASAASTSATNAASSASAASTSATNAAASETNAATSAASALTYSTASAASAVTASTQAGNAATSASAAAGSATNAATSASGAATSASSASTSATNAASSASAASVSAAAALASETAAAASVASIDLPTIVRTTGDQTIGGIKTFSSTIVGSINGNAATVTSVTPAQVSDQANTSTGFFDLPVGTTAQRGSPTSGAIRFNTDTPGYEGYNGSAWGSLGGGNGPAFSATRNGAGNQTVSAATYTKVLFPTEEFDTNSCFASSTFTPTVAGYYQLNAAVGLNSTGESLIQVYKNGSNFKTGQDIVGTIYNLAFSTLVYANGSTDYFEVYAYPGAGTTFSGSPGVTYFQASMVRAA